MGASAGEWNYKALYKALVIEQKAEESEEDKVGSKRQR